MIKQFLTKKYGEYVTGKFLTADNEVIKDNLNKDGLPEQLEIKKHLKRLVDDNGVRLVPDSFLRDDVKWGMDFSAWIGKFNSNKEFFIIGAEPHLRNQYQLIYGFGNQKGKDVRQTALSYFGNKSDIWYYLTKNFVKEVNDDNAVKFLQKCYISDLCHLVPTDCSQVEVICERLAISQRDWQKFRTTIAKNFLVDEIKLVNPKFVVLHGTKAREFFEKELNVVFSRKKQITNWDGYVFKGEMNGQKIIAIPHLSRQVLNEVWRCKKYPERQESVKEIIQSFLTD